MSVSGVKFFTLILFFRASCCDLDYSYQGCKGPSHWAELYEECGTQNQSPINIWKEQTDNVVKINDVQTNFWEDYDVNVSNNGHTLVIKLVPREGQEPPYVYSGPLSGKYILDHFEYHWGDDEDYGSEHSINQRRYPVEQEGVFYSEAAGSLANATGKEDQVVVVSLLLQYSVYDNTALTPLLPTMDRVKETGSSAAAPVQLSLSQFLGLSLNRYVWYKGSLTAPPCTGGVLWIIEFHNGQVSYNELKALRALKDSNGRPLSNNFRPQQPLGGRTVHRKIDRFGY